MLEKYIKINREGITSGFFDWELGDDNYVQFLEADPNLALKHEQTIYMKLFAC